MARERGHLMGHSIAPIPLLARYFGPDAGAPIIHEAYHPDRGWRRFPWKKRVSESEVRRLSAEGVERVALRVGERVADFSVRELLASAAERRKPEPPMPRVCRREACVDLAGGPMMVDHFASAHKGGA